MAPQDASEHQPSTSNKPPSYTAEHTASSSRASPPIYEPSNPAHEPPTYFQAGHPSTSNPNKKRPDPAMRWGITPSSPGPAASRLQEPPPDHPVHKISPADQAKMRAKGVNPVLKAEMDAAMGGNDANGKRRSSFWRRAAMGGVGGGMNGAA